MASRALISSSHHSHVARLGVELQLLFERLGFCQGVRPCYLQLLAYCFLARIVTHFDLRSPIGSPIIVTIWKGIFANNSRTLGRIWVKLGRWG